MQLFYHTIIVMNFFVPVVLAYNLLFGKGKVFHFGPMGAWLATAYAVTITLMATNSVILAIVAGLLMGVLMAAFFTWLSLRLEPDGLGVMTIAVHLALIAVVLNWTSLTRGALGIPGVPRLPFMQSMEMFALITTLVSLLWIIIFYKIDRSAYGRKVSALAEHEWYAKSMGISRARVHFIAFLLLGIGTVIPSLFAPQYLHLLHPNDYQFPAFIFVVMIVVAGKPGSLLGNLLSIVTLVFLREALRFVPMDPSILGPMRLMLFGLILFAAVWWRRDTLFPHQRKI